MSFDKIINRRGTYCTQWDYIEDRFGKGTKDLTPFSISDTDFRSPQPILDALSKVISHGIFGYSRWNHEEYKGAIQYWYSKRYGTSIEKDWIVYSPNVIYSISVLLEKLITPGDKVVTHTPRYDGFSKILKPYTVMDIKLIENNSGEFSTDFQAIEKAFQEGGKVFLLCNPENPTGKIWKKDELEKLISLCKNYEVTLISDDIHMDIARKEVTPVLKLDCSRSIIVTSASKTFNTPALGGSYALIPMEDLRNKFLAHTKEVDSVGSPTIMGVVSTIAAYTQCENWVDQLNGYLTSNCQYVVQELNGFKGLKVKIPEATYLMWIDFKDTGISPDNFKKALIETGKVAIMSGDSYGDPYKLRLNVGCPKDKVILGVEGIKRALDKFL